MILLVCANSATAGENIWKSTSGQQWFYESRAYAGEMVAGTWWESALEPGRTYNISFKVGRLKGKMGLVVGNDHAIAIDGTGRHSFDFRVSRDGKRRLLFRTLSNDVVAGVSDISVTETANGQAASGGSNWIPKGHYLSFAGSRNLATSMTKLLDKPWSASSTYELRKAEDLERALTTPGVRGFWMALDWGDVEVGDGKYDWRLMDANMDVARRYGLKFLVKIADRSFDGRNIMPAYFPSRYVLWTTGGGHKGFVSKRWDPYVYKRLIRLYRAIADRYATHPGFGGIAMTETALGNFSGGGDYQVSKYRTALTQIVTQTQSFLTRGRLFFYLNFIKHGDHADMNKDVRFNMLRDVPRRSLVVGAPDLTPDTAGMPGSVNSYRVHARKQLPGLSQFCHLQHVDQGLGGRNVKTNEFRNGYFDQVSRTRRREQQSWYQGKPAVFAFDDLRDPQGRRVKRHPKWVLGDLWNPYELLDFGTRNYGCDYVLWHYREHSKWNELGWSDIRPVILNNQYFYK